jgi:sigma-B regulation protein RsbQ
VFRSIDGHLINTVDFGSGDPTVLGVSGWIGDWELWQQPFELLSRRCRVVGYDHHGAGETRVPVDALSFDAQVETVFDVMDALGTDRCVIAGESNGGAVAIEAALRDPDRFDALVLVAAAYTGFDDPIAPAFAEQLAKDFDGTLDPFIALCTPEPDVEHIRRWLGHILRRAEPEAAVALIESMYGVDLKPRLSELRLPTLIIHGRDDALPFTRPAVAEEAMHLISGCELQMLDATGHVPTLTRPEAVASAIARFIDRL